MPTYHCIHNGHGCFCSGHLSVATADTGCWGRVTLWMFFLSFWSEILLRVSRDCDKCEAGIDFLHVVLCHWFHQPDQTVLTLTSWMWWGGTEQEFPTVLKRLFPVLHSNAAECCECFKLCSLSHCASLLLTTCSHYQCTRLNAKLPSWFKINLCGKHPAAVVPLLLSSYNTWPHILQQPYFGANCGGGG